VADPLHLTILYEEDENGWILTSIPEMPGLLSQGRTKAEAREWCSTHLGECRSFGWSEHEPQGKDLASESLDIVPV
jgi:hypothetical protein